MNLADPNQPTGPEQNAQGSTTATPTNPTRSQPAFTNPAEKPFSNPRLSRPLTPLPLNTTDNRATQATPPPPPITAGDAATGIMAVADTADIATEVARINSISTAPATPTPTRRLTEIPQPFSLQPTTYHIAIQY